MTKRKEPTRVLSETDTRSDAPPICINIDELMEEHDYNQWCLDNPLSAIVSPYDLKEIDTDPDLLYRHASRRMFYAFIEEKGLGPIPFSGDNWYHRGNVSPDATDPQYEGKIKLHNEILEMIDKSLSLKEL